MAVHYRVERRGRELVLHHPGGGRFEVRRTTAVGILDFAWIGPDGAPGQVVRGTVNGFLVGQPDVGRSGGARQALRAFAYGAP